MSVDIFFFPRGNIYRSVVESEAYGNFHFVFIVYRDGMFVHEIHQIDGLVTDGAAAGRQCQLHVVVVEKTIGIDTGGIITRFCIVYELGPVNAFKRTGSRAVESHLGVEVGKVHLNGASALVGAAAPVM